MVRTSSSFTPGAAQRSESGATRRYTPAWWLPDGHSRTIWGKFLKRVEPLTTEALTWDTPDGDFLELERLHGSGSAQRHVSGEALPHGSGAAQLDGGSGARLLILHGLEGGIHSHYARGLLAEAKRRGWGADLLFFRSCGRTMNRRPRFYHSGETTDLNFVVQRLHEEFPSTPLVIVGVSLGGNVLLKWLGENGAAAAEYVRGAAAISVPYDLERSARRIGKGFSRVYQRVFLKTLIAKATHFRVRFPELLGDVDLNSITSLEQFDDLVTAPVHGFAGAHDYYSRSSSLRFLSGIRVPTLLLSAVDDPFLPPEVLGEVRQAANNNSCISVEFVPLGGHVGFVSGVNPFRPFYYAEWRSCSFLSGLVGDKQL